MYLVLSSKTRQFHEDQRFQRQCANLLDLFTIVDIGNRFNIFLPDLLSGEYDVYRVTGLGSGTIQKHGDSRRPPENEPDTFQSIDGCCQIIPPENDIDVPCVSNGGFIHLSDPDLHGITADNGVWNAPSIERLCNAPHSILHLLHGSLNPFPKDITGVSNLNHIHQLASKFAKRTILAVPYRPDYTAPFSLRKTSRKSGRSPTVDTLFLSA